MCVRREIYSYSPRASRTVRPPVRPSRRTNWPSSPFLPPAGRPSARLDGQLVLSGVLYPPAGSYRGDQLVVRSVHRPPRVVAAWTGPDRPSSRNETNWSQNCGRSSWNGDQLVVRGVAGRPCCVLPPSSLTNWSYPRQKTAVRPGASTNWLLPSLHRPAGRPFGLPKSSDRLVLLSTPPAGRPVPGHRPGPTGRDWRAPTVLGSRPVTNWLLLSLPGRWSGCKLQSNDRRPTGCQACSSAGRPSCTVPDQLVVEPIAPAVGPSHPTSMGARPTGRDTGPSVCLALLPPTNWFQNWSGRPPSPTVSPVDRPTGRNPTSRPHGPGPRSYAPVTPNHRSPCDP